MVRQRLTTREIVGRLEALAEHQHTDRLSSDPKAIWREVCREAADRLTYFQAMFDAATEIQGDDEVLKYVTSGNAIPVTRCTVSADLIRQLVEARRG